MAMKDAMPNFRNGTVRALEELEKKRGIMYINTGGKSDHFDKDSVGLMPWRSAMLLAQICTPQRS